MIYLYIYIFFFLKICGQFLISALGFPEFSELLDATSLPVHFCQQQASLLLHLFPQYLILLCCDKFPCYSIQQPDKVCILQLHLRIRRCVGFWISSHPALWFPWSCEFPATFGCNRTFHGWGTCRNSWSQVHRCSSWFFHNSFFFLFLHPLRHRFGAAYQAGILSAARFYWLGFGDNGTLLQPTSKDPELEYHPSINPRKEKLSQLLLICVKLMSVSCTSNLLARTSDFQKCTSLKDIQRSTRCRMRCNWWNVINVCWNDVGVFDWDGVMHLGLNNCRRVSPWLSLGSISSVRYGMKYFNHEIPKIKSGDPIHA